jgi:hypothetical protein
MFLHFLHNTVAKTGYEQQVQPLISLYNRKVMTVHKVYYANHWELQKQGNDDEKIPTMPPPPEPLLPIFIKFNGISDLNPVEVRRHLETYYHAL